MKPQILLWLCSSLGAVLFFVAGLVAVRRRTTPAPAHAPAPALGPAPSTAELVALRGEAAGLRQQAHTAHDEVGRLRQSLTAAEGRLHERDGEVQRLSRALDEVKARTHQEAASKQAELAEAQERLAKAITPKNEQTLRQDLAVKNQLLQAQEARLRRVEDENAQLRQEVVGTATLRHERERLQVENAQLRAKDFATRPPVPKARAVPVPPAGAKRGDIFQAFVAEVSRLADVRCAVIADELGLVVASQGEMSEEVAAVGVLFSRAGAKALEVLPMRNVHRVTIEDDQKVALTLRPLQSSDGMDSDLTLITLGVGTAPDSFLMNKLMNDVPATILSF